MPSTLTPEQASALAGSRNAVALSRTFGDGDSDLALRYAQVGMPFVSEHSAYLSVHLGSPEALDLDRLRQLAATLHAASQDDGFSWVAVTAVSFDLWSRWCAAEGRPIEEGLFDGADDLRRVLAENQPPYALDGGELFFQVQSLAAGKTEEVARRILAELDGHYDPERTDLTIGDSLHAGRIYGGRMLHGVVSSVDPVGFSARALIGDERPRHKGGCFCLTQRFVHDWQQLLGMADSQLEDLIGRDHHGNIVLNDDERSHVKLVRVNDGDGLNYRLVGQSQPFRRPDSMRGKEDGIFQVSYAQSAVAFARVLEAMIGDEPGYIKSRHLNVSHADLGSYWYVPSAPELGLPAPHSTLTVLMNEFFDVRSDNGHLFYNCKDYLYRVGNRDIELDPPVSDRVIELLGYTFSRWHDTWYRRREAPELGHLKDHLEEDEIHFLEASVAERKGLATQKTLQLLSSDDPGRAFDTFRLHPRELLVGVVPDFTLGSGFEAMKYLDDDERQEAFVLKVEESGAAGHNVPHYERLLELGLGGLVDEIRARLETAPDEEAREFYSSTLLALEGVQAYLGNYAALARRTLEGMRHGSEDERANLEAIAERLGRLATERPTSLLDAAQLVFSLHCCLHISAEAVSIGRLDQLLAPFYEADEISEEEAQEIIDCFWIKMDEKVLLNHRHFNDRLSRGSGAITFEGGDFPQGAALNQWVQQVTVGGYEASDAKTPRDAANAVTRMCLRAARRLPLNAPCLSLRVHSSTPEDIFEEAAALVLSGGGHPFLINDDKIVPALLGSGKASGCEIDRAHARDMTCDGCFESLFAGRCEFAFSYVPVPEAIEMALNRGRTYAAAGPVHITGLKASLRTRPAAEIRDWDEFYEIFLTHFRFKLLDFFHGMLTRYGNLSKICPSPLLSPLIDGCLERGRDLTAGGARYKLIAPLMNGIATAIDSLWAIRTLVFGDEAVFTLPELRTCLICDWGHDMKEPFFSSAIGEDRIATQAERFKNLRDHAVNLPKFGQGHDELDRFARGLMHDLVELAHDLVRQPSSLIAADLESLRKRYGTPERPFEIILTPGIATFEDYAGVGSFLGASADGRRIGQSVPSDFSPSTSPEDLPVPAGGRPALASLRSWAAGPAEGVGDETVDPIGVGLSNGAPVDINIREDFPHDQLVELIRRFAQGKVGSNEMTISCGDPETMAAAQRFPERYDLLRLRMGGWSEFFVAMFPHHQEQHLRRPIFEAEPE